MNEYISLDKNWKLLFYKQASVQLTFPGYKCDLLEIFEQAINNKQMVKVWEISVDEVIFDEEQYPYKDS